MIDNRKFWRTVKPMLLNKLVSSEKNTSVKNDKIIADDTEIANVFKKLKITETLKTPQANHSDSISI